MRTIASPPVGKAELEISLLAVLLAAESARDGVVAMLQALTPALDDLPAALAVRDRDGLTLHVLAESGHAQAWPTTLEPQFALGAQHGVDSATSAMVVPLRAHGRVIGALLLGDAPRAAALLANEDVQALLATTAAVLHVLASRTEAELRRRAVALRSVEGIIDGMAHQISNPLTGASAIAQLLIEDVAEEGHRAAIRQIRQELARAFAVLHDLLEFQRDTHAQDGILDLNTIVERVVRFRGYAIREQGISLETEPAPAFLPVRADARSLEHALTVALRFAELHSHGTVNRRIAIKVMELPAAELAVQITDSGPGDLPDLSPLYFDLPFRVDDLARTAAAEPPDLGLVDSVLRGCGGRLEVRGSKTDGTTLSLVVPKAYTTPPATSRKSS